MIVGDRIVLRDSLAMNDNSRLLPGEICERFIQVPGNESFFDRCCSCVLSSDNAFEGVDPSMKQWTEVVVSILVESAKLNLSAEELKAQLGGSPSASVLSSSYESHRDKLRQLLGRIGWNHPSVAGIDWKLSYQLKSNMKEAVRKPLYSISLKLEESDSTEIKDFSFQCTTEQLQAILAHFTSKMKRMGMMIGIKAEHIPEYKKLHADVWPKILEMISSCNIKNYSIFLKEPENILFGYWEYHGEDFQADMEKMKADPETQRWWAICSPMQEPLETRKEGEHWAMMEQVFHHD